MSLIKKKQNLEFLDNSDILAEQLEIIITRKCNMACKHCMRGNAQNSTISKETLDAIFSKIVGTLNLSLGGGEPSLAPDAINDLVDVLIEKDVFVPTVNFTLNGTNFSQEFADAVKRLETFVSEMRKQTDYKPRNEEDTPVVFCFSFDKYHTDEFTRLGYTEDDIFANVMKYREQFPEANFVLRYGSNFSVIKEGRAKSLIDETPKVAPPKAIYPVMNAMKTKIIGGIFVISCDGEVVPVNTSFENEQALSAGNLKTDSIREIMEHLKVKVFTDSKKFNKFEQKELTSKFFVSKGEIKKFFRKTENKKIYNHIIDLQERIDAPIKE